MHVRACVCVCVHEFVYTCKIQLVTFSLKKFTCSLGMNLLLYEKSLNECCFVDQKRVLLRYFVNSVQISAQETILVCDERSADWFMENEDIPRGYGCTCIDTILCARQLIVTTQEHKDTMYVYDI